MEKCRIWWIISLFSMILDETGMLCLLLLTSITKLLWKPEKKYGRKCRFSSASLRLLFLIYFIAFICISIYHPFPLTHFVCMFVWPCLFDIMYYYCVNDIKCDFFVSPALMFWSWLCCVCCVGTYTPTQRHTNSNTQTHRCTPSH